MNSVFVRYIQQDIYRSYQGWHTFPVSKKESIPQWNGTDVRRPGGKTTTSGGVPPQGPDPGAEKLKVENRQQQEDRTQRKISSYMKLGSKRASPTNRGEPEATAPKRVATEEEVLVDVNQNSVDQEGDTGDDNIVEESGADGSEEDNNDRSGEAAKSKTLDAEQNGVLGIGNSEHEENSQSGDVSAVVKLTSAAQNMPLVAKNRKEKVRNISGSEEDEDDGNGLSGDRSKKGAGKSKALDTDNKDADTKENPEDEVGRHSEGWSAKESPSNSDKTCGREEKARDDDNILIETSQEKRSTKAETSSKPQKPVRPKRNLRTNRELYATTWMDTVDSDYEEKGDDPQWTEERRTNRIRRHGERLKIQPDATGTPAPMTKVVKLILSKSVMFPSPKVLPSEFEAIVAALTSDESKPTCRVFTTRTGTCPGQAKFHKAFYRLIDSNDLDPEVKSKLLQAEQEIFIREVCDCTISVNLVLRCCMVATGRPIQTRRT